MLVLLCGEFTPDDLALWTAALASACPEVRWLDVETARGQAASVCAAVVANPPRGSLQGWPALKLIQSLWAGVDRLLADPTLPAAVPLARMVDPAMGAAMAQTALWATLSLQRDFFQYARQQTSAVWQPHPQRRADRCRVGLLGLGAMGRSVAQALKAQGFPVRAWVSQARTDDAGGVPWVSGRSGLAALLPATDVLINLLPLTPATEGLIDARLLATLPPGAGLVNLARGAHVVEADLLAALDGGRLAHAVLDVFAAEPLPAAHRFWTHPKVTVLPHVAAATDPETAAGVVAANLQALRAGQPLRHLVNRDLGY